MNNVKILYGDSVEVAPKLLGSLLIRTTPAGVVVTKIVETEAYHQRDAASHSYRGKTPRNSVMFGPAGVAYVYFTYGMHFCFNVVTGEEGEGSAVLVRALEPVEGLDIMRKNRGGREDVANGPAKLCQALAIDRSLNGHNLTRPPLQLVLQPAIDSTDIIQTTRIGISREQHQPWRFYIKDNPFISKK